MGKVKSTALGEAYNIFGPGLSPANAKERGEEPRELIATLAYATSLFQTGGPRRFTLFQLQPGVRYYRDFAQVAKYGEEVSLNVLHAHPGNRGKIRVLHSRKPILVEDSYILNFRGMAPCPSVKNFILEDESVGREVALFGKQDDSTFNLDVSAGVSPYVAFAIALANFDNRLTF
jgi:hypothetical protein